MNGPEAYQESISYNRVRSQPQELGPEIKAAGTPPKLSQKKLDRQSCLPEI